MNEPDVSFLQRRVAELEHEKLLLVKEQGLLLATITKMAIPLELLCMEMPYIRRGPLGKKLRAFSPGLQETIREAAAEGEAAVTSWGRE